MNIEITSQEIATLTLKKHYHIIKDIEKMATKLDIDVSIFGHIHIDSKGKEQNGYKLPLKEFLQLISSYNSTVKIRVIERLAKLEELPRKAKYYIDDEISKQIQLNLITEV